MIAIHNLKPLRGRIIVEVDQFKYTGRLIMPDNAKRSPTTGKVLAIGAGVTQVQVGETVVYGMYSGTALKFKNCPWARVLTEDEILCIKEGEEILEDETA